MTKNIYDIELKGKAMVRITASNQLVAIAWALKDYEDKPKVLSIKEVHYGSNNQGVKK